MFEIYVRWTFPTLHYLKFLAIPFPLCKTTFIVDWVKERIPIAVYTSMRYIINPLSKSGEGVRFLYFNRKPLSAGGISHNPTPLTLLPPMLGFTSYPTGSKLQANLQ